MGTPEILREKKCNSTIGWESAQPQWYLSALGGPIISNLARAFISARPATIDFLHEASENFDDRNLFVGAKR